MNLPTIVIKWESMLKEWRKSKHFIRWNRVYLSKFTSKIRLFFIKIWLTKNIKISASSQITKKMCINSVLTRFIPNQLKLNFLYSLKLTLSTLFTHTKQHTHCLFTQLNWKPLNLKLISSNTHPSVIIAHIHSTSNQYTCYILTWKSLIVQINKNIWIPKTKKPYLITSILLSPPQTPFYLPFLILFPYITNLKPHFHNNITTIPILLLLQPTTLTHLPFSSSPLNTHTQPNHHRTFCSTHHQPLPATHHLIPHLPPSSPPPFSSPTSPPPISHHPISPTNTQ